MLATAQETRSNPPKPSDPKQPPPTPKPGDPPHTPPKPGEPHQPHAASEGEEEQTSEQGQRPAPRAVATAGLMLTNSSLAPGPVWFELTNTAAFALTVGVNTLTATVPLGGAPWLSGFTDLPMMCVVFPAPTFVADPGLPVPQSANKLTGSAGTAMVATGGVRTVLTTGTAPNFTITITAYVQTAASVAAGSRWLVMSVTGV